MPIATRSWARLWNDTTAQSAATGTTQITYNQTAQKGGARVFGTSSNTITIPTGCTAFKVKAAVDMTALLSDGLVQFWIELDGVFVAGLRRTEDATDQVYQMFASPIIPCSAGQIVRVYINHPNAASRNLHTVFGGQVFIEDMTDVAWARRPSAATQAIAASASYVDLTFTGTAASNGAPDFLTGAPANGFIIPSGVTGIHAGLYVTTTSINSYFDTQIIRTRSGDVVPFAVSTKLLASASATGRDCYETGLIPVEEGDLIEAQVRHGSGSSKNFHTSGPDVFSIWDATGLYSAT